MRTALALGLVLAACSAPGYRDPGDSDGVRQSIEDRNIASRVRIALARDPETAPYEHIRVTCTRGSVTLEGEVDRPEVRQRALRIVRGCEGVREVTDAITVRGPSG